MLANRVYRPRVNSTPLHEANFHRLVRLLPPLDETGSWTAYDAARRLRLELLVRERFPYTSMVELRLFPLADNPHFASCCLNVRICHDARVAEVTGYQQHRRIASNYPYPNTHMLQPDERWQVNVLLKEVLDFCQQQGIRFDV